MNNQVESAFSGEKPAQSDAAAQTDAAAQVDAVTQTGATAQVDAAAQTGATAQAGADTQAARSFDRAWDQMRPVTLLSSINLTRLETGVTSGDLATTAGGHSLKLLGSLLPDSSNTCVNTSYFGFP